MKLTDAIKLAKLAVSEDGKAQAIVSLDGISDHRLSYIFVGVGTDFEDGLKRKVVGEVDVDGIMDMNLVREVENQIDIQTKLIEESLGRTGRTV